MSDELHFPKYDKAYEFGHMLTALKSYIDSDVFGQLLIVEVANLHVILSAFGVDYADKVMSEVKKAILEYLKVSKENVYIISINKVAVVLPGYSKEDLKKSTANIFKIIQGISCNSTKRGLYILSIMGSASFEQSRKRNAVKDIVYQAYVSTKYSDLAGGRFHNNFSDISELIHKQETEMANASMVERAIQNGDLRLALQPIVATASGEVAYNEALLRIKQGKELLTIGSYINICEETGIINQIDDVVLEMVVKYLRDNPEEMLSFNLSSYGMYRRSWIQKAKDLLSDPSMAKRLIVEITETAFQKDLGAAAYFIASMQDLGCKVALDDFGSGHTSFRQLRALPVDIVKIDGMYIKDLMENREDQLLVNTFLQITQSMGITSVAEFVPSGEVAKLLIDMGIDYMQGNYFGVAKCNLPSK